MLARLVIGQNPLRRSVCSSALPRLPSPSVSSVRPPCAKSSPQIAPPMARKALANGVGTPARRGDGDQQRQPKPQILTHIAVLGQHDPLTPVAGIGQPVVRATAIHPDLALLGVVVGQRKMRCAIAKRFAHRDPFCVERVGHPADRGLRSFLVDVPSFEMLDRARVHHDQRRVNNGPSIHQRAGERIAAGLDRIRESASDHFDCMRAPDRAETRQPAAAWRGW